ncbi:Bax inhibitor-1/YccA family protein [Gammaproteobacteria bacterium]|nr:Bax inhibitor-1/YccA family protein [Gammaproteobacteria bacterium]
MSKHSALNTFGRSANPAFTRGFDSNAQSLPLSEQMTLDGAVNKTGILLSLCFTGAIIGWNIPSLIVPAAITGLILAMVTIFRSKEKAGSTAPLYALAQGIALGGITLMYENQFDGIAIQAIGLTFGILASLLICYKSGLIKPTENFKLMVGAGIGGIFILYMVSFVMSFFGAGISLLSPTNGSLMSIGLSIGIVCIASLSLVLDFDFIEEGVEKGLPKYMEWYGAFSLMVTLVWLYLEILRLLSKMRSR